MVVLLDTNVVLNYMTGREDKYAESCFKIIALCSQRKLNGIMAFHSVSIIWYALKLPAEEKRMWLRDICRVLTVVGATHKQVVEAISRENFRDFEDCLQDECACAGQADFIVTCNKKDFQAAKTKALTPDEFLAILKT